MRDIWELLGDAVATFGVDEGGQESGSATVPTALNRRAAEAATVREWATGALAGE